MNIVILDGYALNPGDLDWTILDPYGTVTIYDRTESFQDAVYRASEADILLINKTPVSRELLENCSKLKLICVLATGYNVVDCSAAKDRGIPVCNVPSYGTDAVAQFTIALLLEICHRAGLHDELVHQGRWQSNPDFCFWVTPQMELAGKTLGIIGFGKIGRAVGRIASALGMNVLAYSRSQCAEGQAIGKYVSLPELLSKSDVISLHCPLFPETKEIINAASIQQMKTGVILLNTSRGPLINEQDLADALTSGKIRAAAVDVVSDEPIRDHNPLLQTPNCIITPHMAWAPTESRRRLLNCVAENIKAFINGYPQNVVNP